MVLSARALTDVADLENAGGVVVDADGDVVVAVTQLAIGVTKPLHRQVGQ